MVAAGDADQHSVAERLGIKPDMVVQEIGWDEDVDDDRRAAIEAHTGAGRLDGDADEVIDVGPSQVTACALSFHPMT